MRPNTTSPNRMYRAGTYAKLLSNHIGGLDTPLLSDSPNIFLFKNGPRVFASMSPEFNGHISHIGSMCAKKEMIRTYTWRIVTMVADHTALRDRAKMQFPGDTVSMSRMSLVTDVPVAIFVSVSLPVPAAFSPFHKCPKALSDWFGYSGDPAVTVVMSPDKIIVSAPSERSGLTAATFAEMFRGAKLRLHRKFTPFVAKPPAVRAARGISHTSILPQKPRHPNETTIDNDCKNRCWGCPPDTCVYRVQGGCLYNGQGGATLI